MSSVLQTLVVASFLGLATATGLSLQVYNNTVLAGKPISRSSIATTAVSLPGSSIFSAEVIGTFTLLASGSWSSWSWNCNFENIELAFVTVDGHSVCNSSATYNNSVSGMIDSTHFRLLSKRRDLVIRMQLYHLKPSGAPASANVTWCASPWGPDSGEKCQLLPESSLSPVLPTPELKRRQLQRRMARGWGSWLHRDILSIALLPDSAIVTVMLCKRRSQLQGRFDCLREAQIDENGGSEGKARDKHRLVRIGRHAMNHSYSQAFVRFNLTGLNISIEYTTSGLHGRQLDLIVTPQAESGIDVSDYAVAFAGSFAWDRVGVATTGNAAAGWLQLQGHGLEPVTLACTAPSIELPGDLADVTYYAASLAQGAVGLTTISPGEKLGSHDKRSLASALPSLQAITERITRSRQAEEAHDKRFDITAEASAGPQHHSPIAELTEALTAALSWRNIWTGGAEDGPVLPMTYGFSWITPMKKNVSNDWKYILFCWDNIFASYTAAVLGYRDIAYSNLIQIVKAKSRDGFVPNWAAGGSKNTVAEPAVGGRVLLELYRRFKETWIVELLFDDLLDWNNWQWGKRRTVSNRACCEEPGFITIGNDYSTCGSDSGNCPGGGESGLDQSPLWDCPGAAPDGSGGDCSLFENKTGRGPNPDHVLQIGDTQSTSLFVVDARSLADLAAVLNRSSDRALLLKRASLMQVQLQKLWDPEQQFFADLFVQSGAFSTKLTPTALYPLMAGGVTPAQAKAMVRHLMNESELCVSASFSKNPSLCYWGLPSISCADPAFMQPQNYVYWRGYTWGPMTMLTYWALSDFAAQGGDATRSIVEPAMSALANQKQAQMMWHWREHRHICENYSPHDPLSSVAPGDGQTNTECTGWQFYNWGALNGVPALLEAQMIKDSMTIV